MRRDAFTFIELLVALVVTGVVTGSITTLLVSAFRTARVNFHRAAADATVRQAHAFFQAEFRGLSSGDSASSDIIASSPNSIVYRPVRALRFSCRRPDTLTMTVTTWEPYFGLRDLRSDLDSVRLMAMTIDSEHWLSADLLDLSNGKCPGDSPGIALRLGGITAGRLVAVATGSPVMGGEVSEIRSYRDASGEWWVGMRRYQKASRRWPPIQPVLGPLSPEGLEFSFWGTNSQMVTNHTDVARIRVRIVQEAADPFSRREDRESVVDVALRGGGQRR